MKNVLENLEPKNVFYYFEEISRIPRGSGNEKAISDYMVAFAKKHNLWVKQDEAYNIYIKKPATPGYENAPTVILQGHLDMVCEKDKQTEHDFEKEGLELVVEEDFIKAKGTTLGADNGVAIAYQLAVLADESLEHPALEMLMTTEEETGMGGVSEMHPEYLEGKMLINLDTDDEGEFLVSCAGGAKAKATLDINRTALQPNQTSYKVVINQLKGGHSGADIHLERGNANVLMARLLLTLKEKIDLQIASLWGGNKDNVITREAEAVLVVDKEEVEHLLKLLQEMQAIFAVEYEAQDPDVKITYEEIKQTIQPLDCETTKKVIDFISMMPHGIVGQSMQIPGLVESSVNIGVVRLEEKALEINLSIRSAVPSKKEMIKQKIQLVCNYTGATCVIDGDYPAWVYASESPLREKAIEVFEGMYNKKPEIKAIHAGLECGFLLEKMPGLDMIAFGPNVYDIHSPKERVSISSMARVYTYLTQLLKALKTI